MIQKMFDYITSKVSEEEYIDMLDEAKFEYVDYEQMEQESIDDEMEYYNQFCWDEAELDVIEHTLMASAKKHFAVELNLDDHCKLYDMIKEHYS